MLYKCGFTLTGAAYYTDIAVCPRSVTLPKVENNRRTVIIHTKIITYPVVKAAVLERETAVESINRHRTVTDITDKLYRSVGRGYVFPGVLLHTG